MKTRMVVMIVTILFASSSHGSGNKEILEALQIAKVAGMCGALKQITSFQETTQMPGGNEFILRFFQTESARLGMELQDFLKSCIDSTDEYIKLVEELHGGN